MTTIRIRVLTLSALALLFACESAPTNHPDAAASAASSSASDIALTVENTLEKKQANRFAEVGAEARIRDLAAASLRSTGKWDEHMSIVVTVDEFRLRTTAQVAMVGIMAGADRIGAQVALYKDGQVINQQKVSAVSVQGGMVGAKESKRLEGLVTTFAQNVAQLI